MQNNKRLMWILGGGFVALSILGRFVPLQIFLGLLGLIALGALLWDRYEKATKPVTFKWKDVLSCQIHCVQEDGRPSLYARVRNDSDTPVVLPDIRLSLGYSTFTGGTPGIGGNGLDSILLKRSISARQSLAPGASIDLPVDTATSPVAPEPWPPRKPRQAASQEQADMARKAAERVAKAYEKLANQVAAAPSLADFMEENEEWGGFFLDLRPDGQYPGFGFFGPSTWKT